MNAWKYERLKTISCPRRKFICVKLNVEVSWFSWSLMKKRPSNCQNASLPFSNAVSSKPLSTVITFIHGQSIETNCTKIQKLFKNFLKHKVGQEQKLEQSHILSHHELECNLEMVKCCTPICVNQMYSLNIQSKCNSLNALIIVVWKR